MSLNQGTCLMSLFDVKNIATFVWFRRGNFFRQLMFDDKDNLLRCATQWNFHPWYLFVESSLHFFPRPPTQSAMMIPRREIGDQNSTQMVTMFWRAWEKSSILEMTDPRRDIRDQNFTAERISEPAILGSIWWKFEGVKFASATISRAPWICLNPHA